MYKPFHDFNTDIGATDDDIIRNWEKIPDNPWHIDYNPIPSKDPTQCQDEDEHVLHVQNDYKQHE